MSSIGLMPWLNRKIVDPLLHIVSRGAEPKQLAFSAALGMTLGLFPVCGVTVFLCGLAIALLGSSCHAPSMMLANFVATPIELSLVVPFLRFGEFISGGPHFPLTADALKKVVTGQASREVLLGVVHALLGSLSKWNVVLAVARLVCCITLHLGCTLRCLPSSVQVLSSQVQRCSCQPKKATPSPFPPSP
ncbi:uncharacterized protein [Aristolochia californica]|uniref:uncharacterized protein isoform X1 n=1 Tax=Aristolochia californica TaxID=171875 RepID=UPI0035DD3082